MDLRELHASMSKDERDALAARCEISSGYLWQLATQWRGKSPSLTLIQKLAASDSRLTMPELVGEFTRDHTGPLASATASITRASIDTTAA